MLSPQSKDLLDLRCEDLLLTHAEDDTIRRRAFERGHDHATSPEAAIERGKSFLVRSYFEKLRDKVGAVHRSAIEVIRTAPDADLDEVPVYVRSKIAPFVSQISAKVAGVSSAPFSREEPNILVVYVKLDKQFGFDAGIEIAHRRQQTMPNQTIHIHGSNSGPVGIGNTQTVDEGSVQAAGDQSRQTSLGEGKEKKFWLKYFILPLSIGLVVAVLTWWLRKP